MGPTTSIEASIIIATYNRANYLSTCLEAVSCLDTDRKRFEVIVIDNNSQDNTRDVIMAFAESYPDIDIRYYLEKRQGATIARNGGIIQARGEIICFLDDDAFADSQWLNAMMAGFDDTTVGCAGGPAILDYDGREQPPWLLGDLQGLLSGYALDFQEPTAITEVGRYPYLCNMAIRKRVFDEVGLFRPELGPSGNNLVLGEETELMERMSKAGWQIMYLPEARVRHMVAPERLNKEYIYLSGERRAVTHIFITWDKRIHMIARWLASDLWYTTRTFFWFVLALLKRKPLWFDDYLLFWMVARRIPVRIKALLFGKESIAYAKSGK